MIIDAHHHLAKAPICPYSDEYAEAVAEIAAEFQVDYFCIMGIGDDFSMFGGNREIMQLAEKSAHVLPVACLNMDHDTPETVRDYDRAGFVGFKVINNQRPFNVDEYLPLYEAVAATGKYLYFHTGMLGGAVRSIDSSNCQPLYLDRVAHLFPEMPIIFAHLGFPQVNEALSLHHYHQNIYMDLTGGPMGLDLEWFRSPGCFYEINWDKVVFGTDSMVRDFAIPFNNYQRYFDFFQLPENKRQAVLGKTMATLIKSII